FHASERGKITGIHGIYGLLSDKESRLAQAKDIDAMLQILVDDVMSVKEVRQNINIKHFEVILRALLRDEAGKLQPSTDRRLTFWPLNRAARAGSGLFDKLAFGRTNESIMSVVDSKQPQPLDGLRTRIILGGLFPENWK